MGYAIRPETRRRTCPGCNRVRFIPIGTAPYCMESCRRAALRREAESALGYRFISSPSWPGAGKHEHRYQGQVLRHAHTGGHEPHGYFEHPEDIQGGHDG